MSAYRPPYLRVLDALRRREGLFRVLMFTLVTVLFWIGFTIYLSQQKTKIPPDIQKYTIPLNPTIDRKALEEITKLRQYSLEELSIFPIYDRIIDEEGFTQLIIVGTQVSISTESAQEADTIAEEEASSSSEINQRKMLNPHHLPR